MPALDGPLTKPRFAPIPEMITTEQPTGRAISQPGDRHTPHGQRAGDAPFIVDGDILDVYNDASLPTTFRWARRAYTVQPGDHAPVPFEALVDALGDPRSVDSATVRYDDGIGGHGLVATRYDELCRMFARYGVQNESIDDLQASDKLPRVRCFTLRGERVNFPAERPDMTPLPVANEDEGKVSSDVTRMIAKERERGAAMEERLEALEAALAAAYSEREAPVAEA